MKTTILNDTLHRRKTWAAAIFFVLFLSAPDAGAGNVPRERISLNEGWRFYKYPSGVQADELIYDIRPRVSDTNDNKAADSRPTEAVKAESDQAVLKHWILPSGRM